MNRNDLSFALFRRQGGCRAGYHCRGYLQHKITNINK